MDKQLEQDIDNVVKGWGSANFPGPNESVAKVYNSLQNLIEAASKEPAGDHQNPENPDTPPD